MLSHLKIPHFFSSSSNVQFFYESFKPRSVSYKDCILECCLWLGIVLFNLGLNNPHRRPDPTKHFKKMEYFQMNSYWFQYIFISSWISGWSPRASFLIFFSLSLNHFFSPCWIFSKGMTTCHCSPVNIDINFTFLLPFPESRALSSDSRRRRWFLMSPLYPPRHWRCFCIFMIF